MAKFQNISIDYKQLLKKTSVSDRVKLIQSNLAQDILTQLPPSERAKLFPKYFRDRIPSLNSTHYSNFTSSWSGVGASNLSRGGGSWSSGGSSSSASSAPATTTNRPAWADKVLGSRPNIPPPQYTKGGHPLADERAIFRKELNENPALKRKLAGLLYKENIGAGPAVIESLFNRLILEGEVKGRTPTIEEYLNRQGKRQFYGPIRRGANLSITDKQYERAEKYIDEALDGSNVTEGATDQGSGNDPNVRHKGGRKVINGEVFNDYGGFGHDKAAARRRAQQEKLREYIAKANPSAIIPQKNQTGTLNPDIGLYPKENNKSRIIQKQFGPGTIRSKPISSELEKVLNYAAEQTGVEVEVISGGQAKKGTGGRRTGSTRHDDGNAADIDLYITDKNGNRRRLDFKNDRAIFEKFVSNAVSAGATGIGGGKGYMDNGLPNGGRIHVGFGAPHVWGAGGSSKNAPDWLRKAYDQGKQNPVKIDGQSIAGPVPNNVPVEERAMTFGHPNSPTAVPALPDNIPDHVRDEISKLSPEDQEAIRQKIEELGPTGIETITKAIEESPSPKAAEAAIEAVQTATPAEIQSMATGQLSDLDYKLWDDMQIPTGEQRKKIQESGGTYVSLDTNSVEDKKGNKILTAPTVVVPPNATEAQKKAALDYTQRMVDYSNKTLGTNYKARIITSGGDARGRANTFHVEPFAVYDEKAVKHFTQSPEGREFYAKTIAETFGKLPGAEFSLPHLNSKGKYNPKAQGAVGPWGSEVDIAKITMGDLRQRQERAIQLQADIEATKSAPAAIVPQENQTGSIQPDVGLTPIQKPLVEAPQKPADGVSEPRATQTPPPTTEAVKPAPPAPTAEPQATPDPPKADAPAGETKPVQSSPDVPMMKSGGEVQSSGEDLSIVDNNSNRKIGEVNRGENIRFNKKGRVEVTPAQRIDPRSLEGATQARQSYHDREANQKQEVPQSRMMQGAKTPEKPPTNFTSHEQWGHTETPTSYVRAMAQAKGRKHDGSFPGSRFGEEQLGAI